MRSVWRLLVALALALGALTVAPSGSPASAHQESTAAPAAGLMPSAVPARSTPNVDNGRVQSIAQVGNLIVIGGTFTSVSGQPRSHIAAFDATTGALRTTFAPTLDNTVLSVIPGSASGTVLAGGSFTTVNGVPSRFLVLLDVTTGAIVTNFVVPAFNFGPINDLVLRGDRLYVAGFFTKVGGQLRGGLAALNATTGSLDPFINVQLAEHHNTDPNGARGSIGAAAFDVTQDGTKMVVVGNFRTANGLLRDQLVVIELTGSQATVAPDWATTRYSPLCFYGSFDSYMRGVTFSPDGTYFIVDASGGGNQNTLCDAVARFETSAVGTSIQPTWVDETGGDTVWATAVTDTAVFVGGHNRWMNNPTGVDRSQPGAVPRPGLMALDPVSGRPLAWNPGRKPLGVAVFAVLATPQGLWIGSDTDWIGNYKYRRRKVAFFPYAGGTTVASKATGSLPGTVYLGKQAASGPTNVLYRVNAGGPAVLAVDGGPDWSPDQAATSPYRNSGSGAFGWSAIGKVDSTVPSTTPASIFNSDRSDPDTDPEMEWQFPVPASTPVEVRLYFADRCSCTASPGMRIFDVDVNGVRFLDKEDLVKDVGANVGTMRKIDLTAPGDGVIDIKFDHVLQSPIVNGIEIVRTDVPSPTPVDSLQSISFTGTHADPAAPAETGGIPWGSTHAAFMVGGRVFYGGSDGYLYSASFDGTTWGTPARVDPYDDPAWSDVLTADGGPTPTFRGVVPNFYGPSLSNVTSMYYADGRVYYTMRGNPRLFWRWFSPDSGIIDQRYGAATSSVNFSNADGMFSCGGTLYYATTDGVLHSVAFNQGVVSGASSAVSGPGIDGMSWANSSMFLYQG